MAEYRVYLVDTDDHFYDAIPLLCANDAEAIEQARQLAVGHGVELWQLDRKVAVFPDENKTPELKSQRALPRLIVRSVVMDESNDRKELERRLEQESRQGALRTWH